MPSEDTQNMIRELRSTDSVSASVSTLLTSIEQRLTMALDANNGQGDMAAVRAIRDDLVTGSREELSNAIAHGTAAKDEAPVKPPEGTPAVAGGNVYGSSGGAAGLPSVHETDATPAAPSADTAALKEDVAALKDRVDDFEDKVTGEIAELRKRLARPPASPPPPADNDHVAPGATRFDEPKPSTGATQDKPSGLSDPKPPVGSDPAKPAEPEKV